MVFNRFEIRKRIIFGCAWWIYPLRGTMDISTFTLTALRGFYSVVTSTAPFVLKMHNKVQNLEGGLSGQWVLPFGSWKFRTHEDGDTPTTDNWGISTICMVRRKVADVMQFGLCGGGDHPPHYLPSISCVLCAPLKYNIYFIHVQKGLDGNRRPFSKFETMYWQGEKSLRLLRMWYTES